MVSAVLKARIVLENGAGAWHQGSAVEEDPGVVAMDFIGTKPLSAVCS